MDEPIYEDIDEDGNSYGKDKLPKWRTNKPARTDLLMPLFALYPGRKYFGDSREEKTWRQIVRRLDKGMEETWVKNCTDWAKSKMKDGKFIPLITLLNLILNPVRYREWLAKNRITSATDGVIEINDERFK